MFKVLKDLVYVLQCIECRLFEINQSLSKPKKTRKKDVEQQD